MFLLFHEPGWTAPKVACYSNNRTQPEDQDLCCGHSDKSHRPVLQFRLFRQSYMNKTRRLWYLCPQRFNVLLDRCYATTSPYPNLNTYYDLFVGWDTFIQYVSTVYTVTTWRLTSLYSVYSHTTCLLFPKVHTWRTNKGRAQWRVSEGTVFLWSLQICGAKKSDNFHFLPALRHPTLWGVLLQWITARK